MYGRRTGSFKTKGRESNSNKGNLQARSYTFRDLATATQNFREANLIGEGGFGSVYKGRLESGQASCEFLSCSFSFLPFPDFNYSDQNRNCST